MALIKSKMTQFGFTAEYWKLTDVSIDLMTGTLLANLRLFKDRNWRLSNPEGTVEFRQFSWTIPEMFMTVAEMKLKDVMALVYTKIKEPTTTALNEPAGAWVDDPQSYVNWFADAEDSFEL